jgi:hypothetical protein
MILLLQDILHICLSIVVVTTRHFLKSFEKEKLPIAYEADFSQKPANLSACGCNNWREVRNILAALNALPLDSRLFVWCGNSHHARAMVPVRAGEPPANSGP